MRKFILILIVLTYSINTLAQDLILRKNPKAEINCKIIEIGEDLVYYTAFLGGEDRKFSIDKNQIISIKFSNGEILNIENSMFGKNHYQDNTKNAIKFNFLSPLMGYSEFDYERSVAPGQSWTAGLGIYGLGLTTFNENPIGFSLNGGYRFYRSPDYYLRTLKYAHLLKGSYVMPKIQFSLMNADLYYYRETWDYYYNTYYYNNGYKNVNIASLNLMVTFGKQWVFSNRFLIDLNFGLGYSFSNINNSDYEFYNFGLLYGTGTNFTYTSSLKLGYLFHDKKQEKPKHID